MPNAQWEFKSDSAGWYWLCLEDGLLTESLERFDSPAACVDDAQQNGYLDPAGTGEASDEKAAAAVPTRPAVDDYVPPTRMMEAGRSRGGREILCVEADDYSRHLVAEALYEHEVDFALTPEDAIALAHCRVYDLMFVDSSMCDGDLAPFVDELRLFQPRVPMIICGDEEPGSSCAGCAHVANPVSSLDVRAAASKLLGAGGQPR